jgi:hypothetical protein
MFVKVRHLEICQIVGENIDEFVYLWMVGEKDCCCIGEKEI